MGIAVSIEIYQDTDNYFRWVFLDSSGEKWGPSMGFKSRSAAHADIERVLATSIDLRYNKEGEQA